MYHPCCVCGKKASVHIIMPTFQLGVILFYCKEHKVEGCLSGTPEPGTD